jgi:hypothetical protein
MAQVLFCLLHAYSPITKMPGGDDKSMDIVLQGPLDRK